MVTYISYLFFRFREIRKSKKRKSRVGPLLNMLRRRSATSHPVNMCLSKCINGMNNDCKTRTNTPKSLVSSSTVYNSITPDINTPLSQDPCHLRYSNEPSPNLPLPSSSNLRTSSRAASTLQKRQCSFQSLFPHL